MPTLKPRRTWQLILLLIAALVVTLAAVVCMMMRTEALSVAAPLLGPWAGILYGHYDCTMANVLPMVSWSAAGLGALAAWMLYFAKRPTARVIATLLAFSWAPFWSGLAVLSVLNSTS